MAAHVTVQVWPPRRAILMAATMRNEDALERRRSALREHPSASPFLALDHSFLTPLYRHLVALC